jgi:hypothetical protein
VAESKDHPNDDDLRIDGDRLVEVPIWVLQDVVGLLGLSEAAAMDRRIATKAREEIGKRLSRAIHPAGTA